MARIYVGCFGSGMGHASRTMEVAGALKSAGADVMLSSSGEAASIIERGGFGCNHLPPFDVSYTASGEFSTKATLLTSPAILAALLDQTGREVSNISRFGADVVLSDSALSTLAASKLLRLPSFAILNQLSVKDAGGGRSALSRLLSAGASAVMAGLMDLCDGVLLPDLPPPYTVSEMSLWTSRSAKARYIGFLGALGGTEPDEAARSFASDKRPKVFWQVSGPPLTRGPLVAKALECASSLSDRYVFVVSGGDPAASRSAARIRGGWYYGWCPISGFYFRSCDLVVSRAGHATIGHIIENGKPSLVVPIPRQPEQEGNADKVSRLGIGVKLSQGELTQFAVGEAVDGLIRGAYAERARRLGEWASNFDATKEIVKVALEAASGRGGGAA